MKTKFPHLCQPITLGRVTFRNRMFSAPMGGTDITADCSVGPRTPGFYELRAKGGAAAVTASELVVHPQTDASHMFHINLTTPGNLAGWTFLADAVARHGAVPSVELSHSGQYAGTYLVDKDKKKSLTQFGPSDWVRPDGIPVKALTKEQIADIVKSYGEAATLAKRVGFQMVMVHGGLAGCECAVHLGMEGKQVHLVEMRDSLAVDCNIRHRPILMQQVDKYTTVHTGLQGLRVTEDGLVCKDGEGKEVLIPGKTVICAVGQRSNRDTVNELRGCALFVREIGDCARVSNITNAVYQGYHAALDI